MHHVNINDNKETAKIVSGNFIRRRKSHTNAHETEQLMANNKKTKKHSNI